MANDVKDRIYNFFIKKKTRKVDVMMTAFRDGFQSVYGARVLSKDFLPAIPAALEAGIRHLEVGGGARYQAPYFYCNEDAFDVMDAIREVTGPDCDLQTLARGVNVVGLDSQSSDIIKLHADLFKKHGMTTIRNFDALNDVDNLDYSGRCICDAGLHHEICITLMGLPPGLSGAHTPEFYLETLEKILAEDIPFHSLCFKDASGTACPQTVYNSIKRARSRLGKGVPIRFHTHETAGTSVACYQAALEAGADGIDLSMYPCSGGTCQTDIAVMWQALQDSEFDLGLDIHKLMKAEDAFRDAMKDYVDLPEAARVEPMILFSPMPGGALTANTQMMRDNGILDRYPEAIAAMAEVVAKGGFGTSVTPVSQFYFQQALNNAMAGPWKKIAEGYGKMVLGYFGRTPVPPDPEVVALAQEQLGLEPTTRSPRAINDEDPTKGRAPAEAMLQENGLPITDENVFIAATCKEKGIIFLNGDATVNVRKRQPETEDKTQEFPDGIPVKPDDIRSFDVYVNNEYFKVEVNDPNPLPKVRHYPVFPNPSFASSAAHTKGTGGPAEGSSTPEARKGGLQLEAGELPVAAPLPGIIIRYERKEGEAVKAGETLAVIEAMKMNTSIDSPADGVVGKIRYKAGKTVDKGEVICTVKST